jgi:ssDNA thymidine ADP-ribosyltransferase, DarT
MPSTDPFVRHKVSTLYHFTDRRNLPFIAKNGGLYSLAKLKEMGVAIPAAGGNDWSHEADVNKGLDRYVHLCFKSNHPMEYVARQEGRISDSLFLQIGLEVLQIDGVKFTADVSNKSGVQLRSIEEARKLIDFEVLYTRTNWRDQGIQERLQQAEKYEILVPDHIPLKFIRNLPNG